MAGTGVDFGRALLQQRLCGLDQRSCRIDDVVEDQAGSAIYVADDVHHLGDVDVSAALVDDRQRHFQLLREEPRALHAAGIRTDDRQVGQVEVAKVADQNRAGEEVIDGDVEEPLNLRCMQIDEQRAVGARGGEQVRDQLAGDGDARAVLAVLARVAVVRNHNGDAAC